MHWKQLHQNLYIRHCIFMCICLIVFDFLHLFSGHWWTPTIIYWRTWRTRSDVTRTRWTGAMNSSRGLWTSHETIPVWWGRGITVAPRDKSRTWRTRSDVTRTRWTGAMNSSRGPWTSHETIPVWWGRGITVAPRDKSLMPGAQRECQVPLCSTRTWTHSGLHNVHVLLKIEVHISHVMILCIESKAFTIFSILRSESYL